METLESSRVCRLCGKQSGISINIFDKNENHVKKINAVLPIMVHEMDLLPKHMCHRCSYKLEEFHKFYVDCLKTDADLKGQLSWMRKEDPGERVGVPMVHIENINIKVEPPDYDAYDMNTMVDNVDYINSMSSVTFPVNGVRSKDISKGVAYATYARCGCYYDKADQSNQTSPTNFGNGIPRCSRINDDRSTSNGCVDKSQAVSTNFLATKALRKSPSSVTFVDETTFELSSFKDKLTNVNEKIPRTTIVRNLRPRKKGSVNYAEPKRKVPSVTLPNSEDRSKNTPTKVSPPSTNLDATQIKVEKLDEITARILRPRKRTIDYIGPKRKYSRSIGKNQRPQSHERRSSKTKVRNISNRLKSPSRKEPMFAEDRINLTIKEEQISDLEDLMLDESVSVEQVPKNQVVTGIDDLVDKIDSLPNGRVADVQNAPINCNTIEPERYADRNFNIVGKWKHLKSTSKSEVKSKKIDSNRFAAANCSQKYLRSQDVHLRRGKIRKPDNADVSARNLRRSLRNLTERGKTNGRDFLKAIKDSVKKVPASMKLVDNIKHYCEECNTSFGNKELFKLHACYGH